jgi:hypothetical protein
MSKKHKKLAFQATAQTAGTSHEAEYRIIKSDLIKVVILNAVYLVVILALYYGNQRSGFLDNWFAKVLHF